MAHHDPEPWWTQQDRDTAWIAQQESISDTAAEQRSQPVNASAQPPRHTGKLAEAIGKVFPLQVCSSAAGYYIGTLDIDGLLCSRESQEYWRKAETAQQALDRGSWTQKPEP